jgi:hypothetical protein
MEEMAAAAVVAHVDTRDTRWPLSAWARMNTETIGRQATSRGLSDAVGTGGKVNISVGECGLCQEFAGEAVVRRGPSSAIPSVLHLPGRALTGSLRLP